MRLERLTALELVEELKAGSLKADEVVEYFLDRIKRVEPKLNSLITLNERAVEEARYVKGELAGLPIIVKDNISTKGIRTTCGSKILENYIPPYDAEVITKLKRAGAIILAKANMDEFAMGSSGENSAFGPTRNPWDLERVPGGSSSGSAASVAAGLAPVSLGTDTGGSIRAPASFTGTIGLKPTYGAVSRYGLIAYANSLEQIGPIGRNVKDVAFIYRLIKGEDEKDSTSLPSPDFGLEKIEGFEPKGLKVGIIRNLTEKVDEPVRGVFERAINILSGLGLEIEEVDVEVANLALASYYVIACSEASSNLARYDGVRFGVPCRNNISWREAFSEIRRLFGKEVKVRIMLGTHMLSTGYFEEYYLKAVKVRRNLREEFKRLLKDYDFLTTPTMPVLPWRIGEMLEDPLYVYLSDALTVPANLAGLPAISLPAGLVNGLPVGVQFMADEFQEAKLLGLGLRFEERAERLGVAEP